MRLNKHAMNIIPLISEFEILSRTKNAERMSELETEMILKIFDRFMSMTAIFIIYVVVFFVFSYLYIILL
jgi:hypothetical protein